MNIEKGEILTLLNECDGFVKSIDAFLSQDLDISDELKVRLSISRSKMIDYIFEMKKFYNL